MKAYYLQKADMIWPIHGVNSISEARELAEMMRRG